MNDNDFEPMYFTFTHSHYETEFETIAPGKLLSIQDHKNTIN